MSSYPPFYYGQQPQMYAQQPRMGQPGAYPSIYAPGPNPYGVPTTPYAPGGQATGSAMTQPFIPPMLETPPAHSQQLQTKTRPKHSHRAVTTPLPLKSALKKTATSGAAPVAAAAVPAVENVQSRRRTTSRVKPDKYAAAAPPSTSTAPEASSYHMFVTFKGDSELLLENTLEGARKDIEKEIFPLWPHGAESQFRGEDWIIRFRNTPWNMSGPDVKMAWRLITALFELFARRGFSYMTSMRCTSAQPRMVFQSTQSDPYSSFFLGFLSRSGRRITFINPPPHIAADFGPKLRAFLPNQLEVSQENGLLIVDSMTVKPSHFLMQLLRGLLEMGFDINATVPMARGGPLKMGSRRELLVFKGDPSKQQLFQ
ncbi:hypothetical protein C8R46DRAFT_1090326 [Mycena filopes]|nr:hypothetical protein C8R46DRAFT_1090326 [Mycena filopes]